MKTYVIAALVALSACQTKQAEQAPALPTLLSAGGPVAGSPVAGSPVANAALTPEQETDVKFIKQLFDTELAEGKSYEHLRYLCKQIGPRLSGSAQAAEAVNYTFELFKSLGADNVYKQACMVPHWVRGAKEEAKIVGGKHLNICALGGSVSGNITAQVVEVRTIADLATLGEAQIKGKIVFFNRPMNPTELNTFHAYSGCVDQRASGTAEAAKLGAVAVLVRSMNLRPDDFPHTGNMRYGDAPKIPSAAISTNDANHLSAQLKANASLKVHVKINSQNLPDAESFNVIAEIKGSEFPDQYITIGGHLDSWDLGEGAHDDGAGCVQTIEILYLFKKLGYKPKHSIRLVMFMNEENGLRGGRKYADVAKEKGEKHFAAVESDRGGFTPRGFTIDGSDEQFAALQQFLPVLSQFDLHKITKGGGGADIGPLKDMGTLLIGFEPDSQRYFDYHHASTDVFEAINRRELETGAAAIASVVYMVDKHLTMKQ